MIDPPPILVMEIENPAPGAFDYVVNCTLWDPQTNSDATAMPHSAERKQQRRLMGGNVSTPFRGKNEFDEDTVYFTFPDLSVRTPGTYSLKFDLVVLDLMKMSKKGYAATVKSTVVTDPFHVYNAKDFGGMRPSTELTKNLKSQGCLIPVKKGNSKTRRDGSNDDDMGDDDDDDDVGRPNSKGKKRTKR